MEGRFGGSGASVEDTAVPVGGGAILHVVVGGAGADGSTGGSGGVPGGGGSAGPGDATSGGGGGYSGILDASSNPLVIAGGGGGGDFYGNVGGNGDVGSGGGSGNPNSFTEVPGGGGAVTNADGSCTPGSGGAGAVGGGDGSAGASLTGGTGGTGLTANAGAPDPGPGGGGGYCGGGGAGGGGIPGGGGGGSSYGVTGLTNEMLATTDASLTINYVAPGAGSTTAVSCAKPTHDQRTRVDRGEAITLTCVAVAHRAVPKPLAVKPTGTVTFSANPSGDGFNPNPCTLAAHPRLSPDRESCSTSFTVSSPGTYIIDGDYSGDQNYQASSGQTTLTIK